MQTKRIRVEGRKILAEIGMQGILQTEEGEYRNMSIRNLGYIVDGLIRNADVSVFDTGGTSRTFNAQYGLKYANATTNQLGPTLNIAIGSSAAAGSVTDNNLKSALWQLPTSYMDIAEASDYTELIIGAKYSPDTTFLLYEAGLLIWNAYSILLTRVAIPEGLQRNAYSDYFDAYKLRFPKQYTKWFIRFLHASLVGCRGLAGRALAVRDVTGDYASLNYVDPVGGSPDLRIGSDNTPEDPSHFNLRATIASVGSQSQTVEVDTTLNEVRVVRTGTYTPASNVTLGEIGLFTVMPSFRANTSVNPVVMIARVALPETVTLQGGRTYTIGIVLRMPK